MSKAGVAATVFSMLNSSAAELPSVEFVVHGKARKR